MLSSAVPTCHRGQELDYMSLLIQTKNSMNAPLTSLLRRDSAGATGFGLAASLYSSQLASRVWGGGGREGEIFNALQCNTYLPQRARTELYEPSIQAKNSMKAPLMSCLLVVQR
jgi:hypothetical protein